MEPCQEFTNQMKKYATEKMGYEPTYLPTRVLLGYVCCVMLIMYCVYCVYFAIFNL